ncbi:MAG: hypothetical protein AAGD33_16165 [Actinomycetota bacterium]
MTTEQPITVVVRVWMPDRPGALGQVASRIGAVRGDVLGIEILEQGGDQVIDELTVGLPDVGLVSLLTSEIDAVDGVRVEDVRLVSVDRVDPSLAALASAAGLAEARSDERLEVLCGAIRRIIDGDWAVVIDGESIVHADGDSPDVGWLIAFLAGSGHLTDVDDGLPSDLVWSHLVVSGLTVAAGRSDRAIHERERVRVSLVARLADALLAP